MECELIAYLATKRARLHESQVMCIGWLACAEQAWLRGDVSQMFLIPVTTGDAEREHALVDASDLPRMRVCVIGAVARAGLLGAGG